MHAWHDQWYAKCNSQAILIHPLAAPEHAPCPLQMMEKLLDRTHLEKHIKAPYPDMGIGYEMVQANDGSGLLSGVE